MIAPSIPASEDARVQALHDFDVVGTGPEQEYDDIVAIAAQICNIGTAHVSLIDSEKQWIKAKIGLGVQNLDRELAFCAHTILNEDAFIVPDATKDVRFFDHPLVREGAGIRFYAGLPLTTSGGHNIGSLCVIDVQPRELDESQISALRILSKQVIKLLELRKANKELRQQQEDLQHKNEIYNKLLSIISHDIRSPLASLTGLVDLLRRGSLTQSELQEIFGQVSLTLASAGTLLNDLLQWATAQQQNEAQAERFDLYELPQTIFSQYQFDFLRKKNTVNNLVPENSLVVFDKNALHFVVRNLILNANKFTEEGTISVIIDKNEAGVTLRVNDTGRGMKDDQMNKLFDWRRRNSTPGTKGEKGAGLALLLGYDLLKKSGADLTVESTEGKGTTFSIVLPA